MNIWPNGYPMTNLWKRVMPKLASFQRGVLVILLKSIFFHDDFANLDLKPPENIQLDHKLNNQLEITWDLVKNVENPDIDSKYFFYFIVFSDFI